MQLKAYHASPGNRNTKRAEEKKSPVGDDASGLGFPCNLRFRAKRRKIGLLVLFDEKIVHLLGFRASQEGIAKLRGLQAG